jgi:hypothetical protein
MLAVFEVWPGLPVRYTMLSLSRFGRYCGKSVRLHFEQLFEFVYFIRCSLNSIAIRS